MVRKNEYTDSVINIWEYDYACMKWAMFGTGMFCGVISTGFVLLMLGLWSTLN